MIGLGCKGTHFWRALLSVVVAYLVAIQTLLIAVAGFSLSADAGQNASALSCACMMYPARRRCLVDLNTSDCTHCIFCFAGAHHAVIGTAPAIFHRVNVAMVVAPWLGNGSA